MRPIHLTTIMSIAIMNYVLQGEAAESAQGPSPPLYDD